MAQFNKNTHQYLGQEKTLFEVMMLADQYGNLVGPANPSGMAVDAFGRSRTSSPLTLFDSYHRYQDNGKYSTQLSGAGSTSYNANTSTVSMTVGTASGDEVVRETTRVFAYQPGKSLQILTTFVMNPIKTNLRQRSGYFNTQNGVFLQLNDVASFVRRSYVSGSVVDTAVPQAQWNMDTLDGTGPSGKTIDLTKAQICFIDIEWLGVGSVRCGFVIDGQLIHCHSFHHANLQSDVYMTTAILPGRMEITNTGTTASSSTLKQICFTVISEGGYELRGKPRSVGHPVTTPRTLTTAGTYYPVISIRLKSDRLDAIVLPKNFSVLGIGNNSRIAYRLISNPTLTAASWVSSGTDSNVEYDLSATGFTGGVELSGGYTAISNQSTQTMTLDSGLFKYQLERTSHTNTAHVFTLAVASSTAGDTALALFDWEEL